ncbi:MAG: ribonuclease HI family protein [Herminiimonas sp.]|nr:ribonuclease HI family protein [Herminiimonas sp.]
MNHLQEVSWQAMVDASFHREQVAARRLARSHALSLVLALQRVLEASSGETHLADFIGVRLRAREDDARRQALRRDAGSARHLARRLARLPDPTAWHAWFDGSAAPNPGRLGLGALLQAPDGRRFTDSITGGTGNSNDAEYLALILTLQLALPLNPAALIAHGDSRIVIGDVLGTQAPVAALGVHRQRAQALLAQFASVRLVWIPRAKNAAADELARVALLANTPACSGDRAFAISRRSV